MGFLRFQGCIFSVCLKDSSFTYQIHVKPFLCFLMLIVVHILHPKLIVFEFFTILAAIVLERPICVYWYHMDYVLSLFFVS